MSLIRLPKVQCSLPKVRKYPIDVPGTANISYGHKLRERKSCRIAKHHDSDRSTFEEAEEKRENDQLLKTLDFEKETDRKIRNRNLRQRVQRDMSAYEENLEARREKLRDLVSSEEANLTREVVEVERREEGVRFEEKLARIEELRKRHEEEHEATVTAKKMQRYLASCPDIKRELLRRSTIDAKQCNVAQMADNEVRRLAEKDLDAVWHEIMLKDTEAKRNKETQELERRILAKQETVSTLARQVADKLALEDERKRIEGDEEREHLERLREDVRRTELKNLEMERRKRERLKEEIEEQILTTKKFVAERAREEVTVDRAFRMLAEEELIKEKARAKQDTAALRAELDSYLSHLKNLRQEEAKRDLEVEAVVRQSHKDIEARREFELKKSKEARRRAAQEVLRGRGEQLKTRQEAEKREQRLKMEEREALERQIEMDADLAATEQKENRQKALRYGLELEEQQRYVETARRYELEEERRYHRAEMKKQTEEYQRLADKLLNASESITPHPFKALLKEGGVPERVPLLNEKEGRCYCPPTLTSA